MGSASTTVRSVQVSGGEGAGGAQGGRAPCEGAQHTMRTPRWTAAGGRGRHEGCGAERQGGVARGCGPSHDLLTSRRSATLVRRRIYKHISMSGWSYDPQWQVRDGAWRAGRSTHRRYAPERAQREGSHGGCVCGRSLGGSDRIQVATLRFQLAMLI